METVKRILGDIFDPGLLAFTFLFTGVLTLASSPMIEDVIAAFFLQGTRTVFEGVIMMLSEHIIELVVFFIINTFVTLVIFGWIGKKRLGVPENPFLSAFKLLPHGILLTIILFSPLVLLLVSYIYLSTVPVLNSFLLFLFILGMLVYLPIMLFSFPAMAIDEIPTRNAISEGTTVGERKWIKALLYLILLSSVLNVGVLVLSLIAPVLFVNVLYSTLSLLAYAAVFAEIYILDTHGEPN